MKLLLAAALLLSPLALAAQAHEPGGMPEMPAKPPVPPSHSLTLVNGTQYLFYFVGGRVFTVRVVRPWIQRAGRAPSVLMS